MSEKGSNPTMPSSDEVEILRQALQRLLLAASRYRSRPVLMFNSRVVNASAKRFTELSDAMEAAREALAVTDSNAPSVDGLAGAVLPRTISLEPGLDASSSQEPR